MSPTAPTEDEQVGPALAIVNEFGAAWIRKVMTRNSERLKIYSPNLGYNVRLDAPHLEAISWQTGAFFSELLSAPFGPEGKNS
ncbi:dihydrodiol dehydrogenase [Nocardia sp. NPDC051900]|uniref:dihydrodiol dehydrogenase n=1 Tax=Nocardia sp. NPDC051900 TaxID=3364326 RepID=UPI0037B2CE12